jgi:hypothetical protein
MITKSQWSVNRYYLDAILDLLPARPGRGMMKIAVAHGFGLAEEALVVMKEVAQVTFSRDDSDAALLTEVRDANTLLVRRFAMKGNVSNALGAVLNGFGHRGTCVYRGMAAQGGE